MKIKKLKIEFRAFSIPEHYFKGDENRVSLIDRTVKIFHAIHQRFTELCTATLQQTAHSSPVCLTQNIQKSE